MSKRNRKRKTGAEEKDIFEWEKDRILPENLRDEMETMWEIPQIYHFLQLTKEALNISHLSMYEVERMLLMPKASKQLAHIMTCLLSSPSTTKAKLHRLPPMPYEFWTNILTYKLKSWFKIYQTKRQDSVKVFDTLGVEPEFWKFFPDIAGIEGKDFQDFTFKQRVWILKTVCDTAMHSRKTIQDELAKQPWESQFETILGIDRYGARYIYFPQFLHHDLRVYKHCLDNKILSTVKSSVKEMKPKEEVIKKEESKAVPRITSKKKRRRSRWSNGSLPQKKRDKKKSDLSSVDQSIIDSNSNSIDTRFSSRSRSSSKASEKSRFIKSNSHDANTSRQVMDESAIIKKFEKDSIEIKDVNEAISNLKTQIGETVSKKNEEMTVADDFNKSLKTFLKNEESVVKESSFSTMDDLSKSSKTDDEKLEEISSLNATKNSDKFGDIDVQLFSGLTKDVNISKSDDEKLSESKKCDTSADNEYLNDDISLDKWINTKKENIDENLTNSDNDEVYDLGVNNSRTRRSARIKHISEIKLEVEDAENLLEVCEGEELSSIELRDSLCRISSPEIDGNCFNGHFDENEWKVEHFDELIRDLSISNFQLVADSIESLNELIESISSDKAVSILNTTKQNFVRPLCEEQLLKRMKILAASLEKVETILKESTRKARNKLQREWNNFENGVADEDEDAEDGSNRWLVGSQGWPFHVLGTDRPSTLSHSTSSPAGSREPSGEDIAGAAPTDTSETSISPIRTRQKRLQEEKQSNYNSQEEKKNTDENVARKGKERKERKEEEERKKAGEEGSEEDKDDDDDEDEPEQTTRVLRARGISSYTEQLFSDDESEEDKLDGWADIEAIYASPSAQISTSTPNTPTKSRDSCNDSEKEDSDQDWILPSSRKRKSKRPSASRRLKSFQNKLQNIKVDQDGKINDDQHQQQLPIKDTKVLPLQTIQKIPGNVKSSTKSTTKSLNKSVSSKVKSDIVTTVAVSNVSASSSVPLNTVKIEQQDTNLHSVLDIKDEGPIYDSASTNQNISCVQPNYVVVTTGHAPVTNYYVMQQNSPATAVVQQNQFIQPTAFVSQMPQVQAIQQVQTVSTQGYYVQQNAGQNYIVQNPSGLITTAPRQAFIASNPPQVVYQSQQQQQQQQVVQAPPGYVQYVATPTATQQQEQQSSPTQPRIINTTTLTPPRQIAYRMRGPTGAQNNNRMPLPARQQNFPHPNGAVIRSTPLAPNVLRPGQRVGQPRSIAPRRQIAPKLPNPNNKSVQPSSADTSKTTSLIVLSDSDDEIEMIITEKSKKDSAISSKDKISEQTQKIKNVLPPELMQRMSEGGISISPIKPAQPTVSQNTQLVVVVNETGSHYALALPNGSKLILTPEQVAQIRASNGGKLVL